MGDRTYCQVHCRPGDRAAFERLGFTGELDPEDAGEDCAANLAVLFDEEANYGGTGPMPKDVPFFGFHNSGDSYPGFRFACDGTEFAEALHIDGRLLLECDEEGKPDVDSVATVLTYVAVLKRARKALGLSPQNEDD